MASPSVKKKSRRYLNFSRVFDEAAEKVNMPALYLRNMFCMKSAGFVNELIPRFMS